MRTSRAFVTFVSAGLLVLTAVTPATAADSVGRASGNLSWDGQYNRETELAKRPGRTSIFRVRDGAPGEPSRSGDRGWYRFSERNEVYDQSLTMRVRCVRVDGDWAEFAGEITRATGNFAVGHVFLVSVLDLDTIEPDGLYIGMKSFGDLDAACDAALDGAPRNRKGRYTGGYLNVSVS